MSNTHKKRYNIVTTHDDDGGNTGNSTFTAANFTNTVSRKSNQYESKWLLPKSEYRYNKSSQRTIDELTLHTP